MPSKYGKPDAENPEWTAEDFRRARPIMEVHPEWFGKAKKSPVRTQAVTLHIQRDVVDAYRRSGGNWQVKMAHALQTSAPDRRRAAAKKAVKKTAARKTGKSRTQRQ